MVGDTAALKDDEKKKESLGDVRVLIPGQRDLSLMHGLARS